MNGGNECMRSIHGLVSLIEWLLIKWFWCFAKFKHPQKDHGKELTEEKLEELVESAEGDEKDDILGFFSPQDLSP